MNIMSPLKSQNQLLILKKNIDHYFTRKILCNAPSNARTRNKIEVFFIAIIRPSLKEQINCDVLILLRNSAI